MKRFGIANCLTAFRIVCIPFYVMFFFMGMYKAMLYIYLAGSLTDMVDGTVARLTNANSQFGAILDPIADKLCMLVVFITLIQSEIVPWWFLVIMLVRDVVVFSGFIYVRVNQIPYKYRALWSSKWATLMETIAGTMALIYLAYPSSSLWGYPLGDLVYGSVLIASVAILIATLQYLKVGMKLLESQFREA